jgi:hypothetical protein
MKDNLQDKLDELLTIDQVIKILRERGNPLINKMTIFRWIKAKRLPVYHFPNGAKYGIRLIDIPTYIRRPKLIIKNKK